MSDCSDDDDEQASALPRPSNHHRASPKTAASPGLEVGETSARVKAADRGGSGTHGCGGHLKITASPKVAPLRAPRAGVASSSAGAANLGVFSDPGSAAPPGVELEPRYL